MVEVPIIPKVEFDSRALEFAEKKGITSILIDVEYLEEPCTQIFSPIVKKQTQIINRDYSCNTKQGINVEFSDIYVSKFDSSNDIVISTEGLLKKRLSVKNIDPIIKNVCKF